MSVIYFYKKVIQNTIFTEKTQTTKKYYSKKIDEGWKNFSAAMLEK